MSFMNIFELDDYSHFCNLKDSIIITPWLIFSVDQVQSAWKNLLKYLSPLIPTKTLLESCLVLFIMEMPSVNFSSAKDIVMYMRYGVWTF